VSLPRRISLLETHCAMRRMVDCLSRHFLLVVIVSYTTIHLLHFHFSAPPLGEFYFWAGESGSIASSIVQGKGFANPYPQMETGPSAWAPPLYPYLLAAVFRVAGIRTAAAAYLGIVLQCLLYAGTLWLLYRIVQHTFSTVSAQLATLIWLINPDRIGVTSKTLNGVCLATLTLLLAILALIHFKDTPERKAAALAGLALGFAVLCNPVMVLAVPFYAYFMYVLAKSRPTLAWVAPVLVCTICLGVLAPWIVRNYVVFGKFIFIKSNLGRVLYRGNNPGGGNVDTNVYSSQHERELLHQMGEIAYNRYALQRGLAWIQGNKTAYLERSVKRAVTFWVTIHARGLKRWIWDLYQIALLVSAAVGLWRHWGRSPVTTLCFAILLVVPSVYYLTFFFRPHRYRLPFEVLLTIFSSAALTAAQVQYDQAKQRP
jgi:4-amino-4-deoxy-L-arabinose transferase-like glycosyltransferase